MSEELREDDGSDLGSKLAWFLAGAVIGAAVALLYAPKSGKDTRKLISQTSSRGKDAVAETGKDLVEAGRDVFERGRKLVEDASDLFERGRKLVRG
ncbi:MAG: YtxH domain-containing protein [Bryobacteraceae bacterium]|jgi:gas vesicle protein